MSSYTIDTKLLDKLRLKEDNIDEKTGRHNLLCGSAYNSIYWVQHYTDKLEQRRQFSFKFNRKQSPEKQIPDLKGTWKQTNSKSDDSYQVAKISSHTIEINWVTDNGDTKSLYWAGSFIAPSTVDEPYEWVSKNDHGKTDHALLASSDDTKTMTYQNGVLSYEASAMGTTTKVKLEKQK
ncbi:hypothetical protein ABNN70_00025 [Sporolactobacillus sp. Y61]|uniref:Lipocalin-like domain-containing protein n=1 Tax=Sporolactobacillus sp. Y61 TaxID=3160863 RepID=A0AAU8IGC1_9BACL